VEKITAKVHTWGTRNSYAGRAVLINSVIFGMYSYWACIFLLPNEMVDKITQLCRNYLWIGSADFKKPPYISWEHTCLPKKSGGLGIKLFSAWNKASIAKLYSGSNGFMADISKARTSGIINPPMTAAGIGRKSALKEFFKEGTTDSRVWK